MCILSFHHGYRTESTFEKNVKNIYKIYEKKIIIDFAVFLFSQKVQRIAVKRIVLMGNGFD